MNTLTRGVTVIDEAPLPEMLAVTLTLGAKTRVAHQQVESVLAFATGPRRLRPAEAMARSRTCKPPTGAGAELHAPPMGTPPP